MLHLNAIRSNIRAEVMKADRKVLGTRSILVIGSKLNTTAIVFKYFVANIGLEDRNLETTFRQFVQDVDEMDDFTESIRKRNVLSFAC